MNDNNSKPVRKKGIPWWAHLILAILSYGLLRYGPPALGADSGGLFQAFAGKAAPIAAIVFLLLAANTLYADDPPRQDNDKNNAGSD